MNFPSITMKTVCLPSVDISHEGEYVTVAGWGALSEGGGQPNKLHEVRVKVWANSDCGRRYNNRIPGRIESNMLCASDNGRDSCSVSFDSHFPYIDMIEYYKLTLKL